jgi:hypothetical protein
MNWQPWIAPTILISVVAFLSRFFGKIIADQRPFSDDRVWDIELSGIFFPTASQNVTTVNNKMPEKEDDDGRAV